MDEARLVFVSEALASIPVSGRAICNAWWIVCPSRGLAFWKVNSRALAPQCNANRRITEDLRQGLYPGLQVKLVPVVFVAHAEAANRYVEPAYAVQP